MDKNNVQKKSYFIFHYIPNKNNIIPALLITCIFIIIIIFGIIMLFVLDYI